MKKLPIILFLLSAISLLTWSSCMKHNDPEFDKGNTPLAITASKTTVVLEQKSAATDAVVFAWTTGTNHGTDAGISYIFQLAKEGDGFTNAIVEPLGKAIYSRVFSNAALNDSLLKHWEATPGTPITLEGRVIAIVEAEGIAADTSATVILTATPYQPASTTLYLIGDATPNGWDAGKATALTPLPSDATTFTWQGSLKSGEMKFITTLGQFLPGYNKGADDFHLVYRSEDGQPDDKFMITTPGAYDITLNLLDLSINIRPSEFPPYTRLWMLGDAVPTGWNIDNPSEMRVDSANLFVFRYNEVLKAGEFKIPTATGNFNTDYYMPLTNHQAITERGVQLVPGGSPDNKWQITNPGPYKIVLDMQHLTMDIKPFTPYTQIWMVGDATPAGWNIDNPTPLVADATNPYVFTYTGPLTAGEFKFPLGTGNWGGDYFMPVKNHQDLSVNQMKFVAKGDPDYKWQVTTPGNYKIVINQLYETITITKQ
ncbi:SusF/SusE family outer membrane protein [Flavihumibacter petaseus]|uniref:SusE outer membrane protein domain-containing protein n=1 Tax=Flavihumibacter petaseus NBRC 106054 TaxID=1220578 RepID=A0A0E9N6A0_9BACT|nr:SusF/SusE family outer membrane protein [Flavihumibacter petaseus]GAO45457.1 hypothetical protein FPE01S_05_01520 [Flavihumibacter petaseus NBRC 106054]